MIQNIQCLGAKREGATLAKQPGELDLLAERRVECEVARSEEVVLPAVFAFRESSRRHNELVCRAAKDRTGLIEECGMRLRTADLALAASVCRKVEQRAVAIEVIRGVRDREWRSGLGNDRIAQVPSTNDFVEQAV